MRNLSIEVRMAIAIFATAFMSVVLSFIFLSLHAQQQITTDHIDALIGNALVKKENQNFKQVVTEGVNTDDLTKFQNNPKLLNMGFMSKGILINKLIYVQKNANNFNVQVKASGIALWLQKALDHLLIFSLALGIFSSLILFTLSKIFLSPIRILRRTTEDILAGKFEVKIRYKSKDEIGQTFGALSRLCTELERRDKALEVVSELATTDGLTGLKNHRSFKEAMKTQLLSAQRYGYSLGFLILDVDHFKKFNDTYGHQQGDEVLKMVGKILKAQVRKTDFTARYGGEEFVILVNHTEEKGFTEVAEKFRKAIETCEVPSLADPKVKLQVTASFGGIYIGEGALTQKGISLELATYIEIADQNMYVAKKAGRNRVNISTWKAPTQENAA
ncbi:MAG: diguanylate cyclase [Oligoflexia bacterium]|nr:diguanylate cyclase [Oligoflexia bacterium]